MPVEALTGRVLMDTNVPIYATLSADTRHERARQEKGSHKSYYLSFF